MHERHLHVEKVLLGKKHPALVQIFLPSSFSWLQDHKPWLCSMVVKGKKSPKFGVCYELGTIHTFISIQLQLYNGYCYYKTEG